MHFLKRIKENIVSISFSDLYNIFGKKIFSKIFEKMSNETKSVTHVRLTTYSNTYILTVTKDVA